jgi:hypothetical protein
MTKYFVDASGKYLGGFDGSEPPVDSIEVPNPPAHGLDVWDGTAFVTPAVVVADRDDGVGRLELIATDAASVRAMREFILAKFIGDPLLPTILSDHESAATVSRGKLKPKV